MTTMIEPTTRTIDVPGATLTYDVREVASAAPVLFLIGSEPDVDALRAATTRIVPAVGAESGETLAARGALAVAERLGVDAVRFPSDHGGFLGGEYGQAGDPDAFAARLREVLAGS